MIGKLFNRNQLLEALCQLLGSDGAAIPFAVRRNHDQSMTEPSGALIGFTHARSSRLEVR